MLKGLRLKSLLIVVALLALVGLLSGNEAWEEAALADSAQMKVTLQISNTSDPTMVGTPVYKIRSLTFMKNFVTVAIQYIFPYATLAAGETRTFGPFELAEEPNGLRIEGSKGCVGCPPGSEQPFSLTIFPFQPDIPYQEEYLMVLARFEMVTEETALPQELVSTIEAGQCPCPNPAAYCPREVDYSTFHFPWGSATYRLEWWEDQQGPEAFARKHALAWYNEDSRWAFYLKEVGYRGDGRGHDGHGSITFKLPTSPWGPNNDLALVNYDAQYGGVYYTNPALNRDGVPHAKVFELRSWTPGGWIVCWEDWWGGGDGDFNDEIDILTYPIGP